jgi:aminoglycoside phosphotransferase (APT) family kinase protein
MLLTVQKPVGFLGQVFTATIESIPGYLRQKKLVAETDSLSVTELSGGVSSTVLKIVTPKKSWVLKQALAKLKVQQEWTSSLDRMEREYEALKYLSSFLQAGQVPEVVHYDADNHSYIMTCAPEGSENWKEQMLHGKAQPEIAAKAGSLLGFIHSTSHGDEELSHKLGDKKFFHELRLDPFYNTISEKYPKLADKIGSHAMTLAMSNMCFVHGDYSPKNILVHQGRLILLDFEVGHFGHPSFDVAFMLAHLTLKTIKFWNQKEEYLPLINSFWNAYTHTAHFESTSWHERSFLPHLGCILLARMDGKSPINYMPDEKDRGRVRALASSLITREIPSMRVYLDILSRAS